MILHGGHAKFAAVRFGAVADILPPNPFLHSQFRMEPVVGFEPTTDGLQNRCSTTELNWL
jgi:hypothetical protein